MADKEFRFSITEIVPLVENMGSCVVSDKISVEGMVVGFMYREKPNSESDSGWRFFSGTEDQEYIDNPGNLMLFKVNTIANHDPAIIEYLQHPIGSEFHRTADNRFKLLTD